MPRITHDQKETALEALRLKGTMKAAADAAGVDKKTLYNEMRRSAVFKKHIIEAREEGKLFKADEALQIVYDIASGNIQVKQPQLTAALAILNWIEPGFRGTQKLEGQIQHNLKVQPWLPRPKYGELSPPKKQIESHNNTIDGEELR